MKKRFSPVLIVLLMLVLLAVAACDSTESATESSTGNVRVSVIDVGKGDCILVQSGGESALIDTGYEETSSEVVSYVHDQGIDHIDHLVVTHYDKDHVGGIQSIGEALGFGDVYLPSYVGADKQYRSAKAAVEDLGVSAQPVTEEKTLKLGDATLTLLPSSLTYDAQANGNEGNDNDLSLVATLAFGGDSYLFAGDLEKDGVDAFLEREQGQYDVVKMPHHGRKSSNTDDFLAVVQPKIALITDSEDDPADKKVLKLLKEADAEVYRTGECGTIVVESDGAENYTVSTE